MRALALLGAVVAFVLAACALTPRQAPVTPDYPPESPLSAPRDAGRE